MENLTKSITLAQISYPVFKIGNDKPAYIDGVVIYCRQYLLDDNTEVARYHIIDDTEVPAPTLAKRRLILMQQGIRLKVLGKAVFFLGDLIKLANSTTWFIDSNGAVFKYTKVTKAKLTFKKIKYKHLIPSGGAILEIEGLPTRFKCLFAPKADEIYAGILQVGLSYILYGVYDTQHKDTWRKV